MKDMKLDLMTYSTAAPEMPDTYRSIFPEFGTKAPDMPLFDSDKHMYIVDQYTSAAGNRSVTYVGVSRQLAVEATFGLYHCWTLMDRIRLLVPDGMSLKVVKTFDFPQTTYYNNGDMNAKILELAKEYAMDNLPGKAAGQEEQVSSFVDALVGNLLSQDVDSQMADNGMAVLKAYCRQMNLCRDYVTL